MKIAILLLCMLVVFLIIIFILQRAKIKKNEEISERAEHSVLYLEEKLDDMTQVLSVLHPDDFYHPLTSQTLDEEDKKDDE